MQSWYLHLMQASITTYVIRHLFRLYTNDYLDELPLSSLLTLILHIAIMCLTYT
jgi:hypothetical protein